MSFRSNAKLGKWASHFYADNKVDYDLFWRVFHEEYSNETDCVYAESFLGCVERAGGA